MIMTNKQPDIQSINRASRDVSMTVDQTVKYALLFAKDPDRDVRVKCLFHHYHRPSFTTGYERQTTVPCEVCGADQMYDNQYFTEHLCEPCARQHGLCKTCGSDLRLKVR